MQQPMKTAPFFPSTPITITTEEVQKYLEENKRLILAIMENQNHGNECALYQAQLQKNLIYLAAIADAQPQAPTIPSQTPLQSVVQQEHHIQQPQPETANQGPGVFAPNLPFHRNAFQSGEQQQQQLLQQHQFIQGQMGMRTGANASMHQSMHTGTGISGLWGDAQRGSKQDLLETGSGGSQGGNSASGRLSFDRDSRL